MNRSPLISVLLPVYNSQAYVSAAIDSILTQTLADFELILIDDGSTDCSLEILKTFAACDARIRIISRPNTGLVRALNDGLQIAQGKWIARMDADDISLPERFARQVDYMDRHPECVALGTNALQIDAEGDPIGRLPVKLVHEEIEAELFTGRGLALPHPSAMFPRNALDAIGGYSDQVGQRWSVGQDLDLYLRLAEVGRLANLSQTLLHYRRHGESVSTTKRASEAYERRAAIISAAFQRRGLSDEVLRIKNFSVPQRPVEFYARMAQAAAADGYFRTVGKYAWRMFKLRPVSPFTWQKLGRIGARSAITYFTSTDSK